MYVSVFSTGNELLVSIRIYNNNNKTGLSEKTCIELNDGRLFQNLLKLGYLKALNPTTIVSHLSLGLDRLTLAMEKSCEAT